VATTLNMKATGVLGVLLKACRARSIPDLSAALQDLKTKAGFHLSDEIVTAILQNRQS